MATTTADKPKTASDKRQGHDVSDEARDEDGRFTKADDKPKAEAKPKRTSTRSTKSRDENGNTGAMLGVAAAGVAVGLGIALGRKVAVQAPTVLAGDWDQALAAEHAAVIKIFDAMEATTTKNTGKRNVYLAQLKHALGKHAMQEENVVYPAMRDAGHAEAADHLNHDHGYVKQYLYELENTPANSESFLEIVGRFRTDLEKHVREEEDDLYPSLKAGMSDEANKKVTFAMNKEGFKLA